MNRRPATDPGSTLPLAFNRGTLVPALAVRDTTGQRTDLLALVEGRPAAVVYLDRPRSPAHRQAARHFAAAELGHDVVRTVIVPSNTAGPDAASLAELGLTVCIAQQRVSAGDDRRLSWAVTDKAGRVVQGGRIRPNEVARLAAHLRSTSITSGSSVTGEPLSQTAPVLIVPDVLQPELCERLIADFDKHGGHPSGVLDLSGSEPAWRPDPAVKLRRDLLIEDPGVIRELEQAVAVRVLPEIRKCFQYVVTHHEPFKLVRYEQGSGYFRPHRDNESDDTLHRRFAMTINLNTGEYDGGSLEFPEFGSTTYRAPLGGAIVFSCSLLHEATDVTRGKRYAILGFFFNPNDGLDRLGNDA